MSTQRFTSALIAVGLAGAVTLGFHAAVQRAARGGPRSFLYEARCDLNAGRAPGADCLAAAPVPAALAARPELDRFVVRERSSPGSWGAVVRRVARGALLQLVDFSHGDRPALRAGEAVVTIPIEQGRAPQGLSRGSLISLYTGDAGAPLIARVPVLAINGSVAGGPVTRIDSVSIVASTREIEALLSQPDPLVIVLQSWNGASR